MSLFKIAIIFFSLVAAGCVQSNYHYDGKAGLDARSMAEKEKILLKTKNYENLIALNREKLKAKEDPVVRFQLAEYYYLAGNYNSSLHYLKTSLMKSPSTHVYILQSKNMIGMNNYDGALKYINMAIQREPNNAEALNLRGIAMANKGDLKAAMSAFEMARNAFYTEEKSINNIAMVHIAERRYSQAIQMLLPVYLRGYREDRFTHNLVFALIKDGDLRYAKEIIKRENLSPSPDKLVSALFEVENNMASL